MTNPTDPTPTPGRHAEPARRRVQLGRTGGGLAALAAVAVGVTVLVGGSPRAATDGEPGATGRSNGGPVVELPDAQPVSLATFSGCAPLLAYYRGHALTKVGPYGLPGTGYAVPMGALELGRPAGSAASAAAAAAPVPAAPAAAVPAGAKAADTTTGSGAVGATSVGGTNVQVAGVDEADLAKRVGDLVLTVAGNGQPPGLVVLRTTGSGGSGKATVIGRLSTPDWSPSSLLVDGSRALLIGQVSQGAGSATLGGPPLARSIPASGEAVQPTPMPPYLPPRTRLVQVDLADPAHPKPAGTLDLDGVSVGARMVDGVVRLAVDSSVHPLPFVAPSYPQPVAAQSVESATPVTPAMIKKAEDAATAANRAVVQHSVVADWLPGFSLTQADGTTSTGTMLECADVSAPSRYSGLDTLSLVSLDLRADGVNGWHAAGVIASGTTVYATARRTYLATTVWSDPVAQTGAGSGPADAIAVPAGGETTQVHLFDSSGRGTPRYLASGQVPGALLNQFSMDEYQGNLRVATTTQPSGVPILVDGGAPAPAAATRQVSSSQVSTSQVSTSQVSVLAVDPAHPEHLIVIGRLSGLGRGERIYAVRFIGALGYVVTFRQTDPLYTVDLSDPRAPRLAGELKLLGYSAYLHPAGDGLLIGIGQAADAAGRQHGLQLSLFDVSDPASPVRLSQVQLPDTFSDAQSDHHAFTFADGLALIPFQRNWFSPRPAAATADSGVANSGVVDVNVPYQDAGVLAVRLDARRFSAPAVLRMQGSGPIRADGAMLPQPLRTYLDGGDIWTVTTTGLGSHDATTLKRLGFTAY